MRRFNSKKDKNMYYLTSERIDASLYRVTAYSSETNHYLMDKVFIASSFQDAEQYMRKFIERLTNETDTQLNNLRD